MPKHGLGQNHFVRLFTTFFWEKITILNKKMLKQFSDKR